MKEEIIGALVAAEQEKEYSADSADLYASKYLEAVVASLMEGLEIMGERIATLETRLQKLEDEANRARTYIPPNIRP